MSKSWHTKSIGSLLATHFSGAWGSDPRPGRPVTTVLRATDIDDEGHVDLHSGALRSLSAREAQAKKLITGDVLLEASGGGPGKPVGRPAWFEAGVRQDFATSNFFKVLRPNPTVVDSKFLLWRLLALAKQPEIWQFQQQTTGIINLKFQDYLRYQIELPSVDEQRRIAEILDAVDDQIRVTEEIVAKLKLAKLGTSHDLFDEQDWRLAPLGEMSQVRNGTTPSRARRDYWDGGTVSWLASGKVNEYVVTDASERITTKAVSECGLRILPPGSVIIGMIGEGRTRGMSARLDLHAAINQNLAGVIPGDQLAGGFLHHYLVHSYQRLRGGGRGSNQDALNTKLVSDFLVPLPPLEKQHEIVRTLDALDHRAGQEALAIAKLNSLKGGLMSDLLTGRVRARLETVS
jgi:type I restriction enzyme S subunit